MKLSSAALFYLASSPVLAAAFAPAAFGAEVRGGYFMRLKE